MTGTKFIVTPEILTVKVVVAGPGGVGKTTLLKRYETNSYIPAVSTVGINFLVMDHEVGNRILRIAYWDYAGEDRFRSLFPGYCTGSTGAIVAFDTSRIQTLSELPEWLNMIKKHNESDIPIILVGNKIDTVADETRNFVSHVSERFVKEHNLCGYYLCSAKSGEGLQATFSHFSLILMESKKQQGKK